MPIWTFYDYVAPTGVNQITKWYDDLLIQEQEDFSALLLVIANKKAWSFPEFKPLSGKLKGCGEIRFKSCNKQHRMIGVKGKKANTYILLIGCTHKQNIYSPANALETAIQRKRHIEINFGSIAEHGQ